jgi:hypothetical protein
MSNYVIVGGELCHYGVKGMKWGVRKKYEYSSMTQDVRDKKAAYKQAKKDYNKSFNKAYNKAIAAYSPVKKHRQANDARWEDAMNKAEALDKAKSAYKTAKKVEKKAINKKTDELNKKATFGEKFMYDDATRRQAAKYIVKNNMTLEEATKKAKGDARRNTAAVLAVYGGILAASIYASNR